MEQKKSLHFNIFYEPLSLADKEKDFITTALEKSFTSIIKKLAILDDFPRIKYYLYSNNDVKFRAMGDSGNANAVAKKFAIHGIYNKNIKIVGKHEIVHLLTNKWGRPPELLRQGLAEAMENGWHRIDHHQWARNFYKNKKLIPLKILLDDKFPTSLRSGFYPRSTLRLSSLTLRACSIPRAYARGFAVV